ncbi:MAG: hypothetical protein ACTTJW_08185 [Sphaerochaeta sp.]
MKKKNNSWSVIITILITVIVLAAIIFAGVRYLLPAYAQGQNGDVSAQYQIYRIAVRVFPLLIGIVLIAIASMIATSGDDEEDEEDKLPPNSYDIQLFETPSDDPSVSGKRHETEEPEPVSDEITNAEDAQFVSIFDAPETEEYKEAREKETDDAAYSLFEDSATAETAEESEEAVNEPEPALESAIEAIESKIDKLCDAIANLTALVSDRMIVQTAPVVVEKVVEKSAEPKTETAEQKTEDMSNTVINNVDPADPLQVARLEFESAQEGEYDISYAFTSASAELVRMTLGEICDSFEINGKTVVVMPFLSGEEAAEELDKLGVPYEIETVGAGENADFDSVIASKIK